MADKLFDIVFSGKLAAGSNPAEVLKKIAEILVVDEAQVRELFKPGAGAVIRGSLKGNSAYELRNRLQDIGVNCSVEETVVPPQPAPQAEPANQPRSEPRPRPRPREMPPVRQAAPSPRNEGPGIVSLLFKLVCLAAVAGGGWWAYQTWFAPPSPAFTAYAVFSEAIVRGEYQKAADGSVGDARAYAESWSQMTKPGSMKVYGREYTMSPPSVSSIAGEVAWIKRKRKTETKKSDSTVELQVEQTVCRIPPGVSSAICKWPVTFQHEVELQLVDGSWKVAEFKEVRLTPQDK